MSVWKCDLCGSYKIMYKQWKDNEDVTHSKWECQECGCECTPIKEETLEEENNVR